MFRRSFFQLAGISSLFSFVAIQAKEESKSIILREKVMLEDGRFYIIDYEGAWTKYYNDKHQLHREDGPAIIYDKGEKQWFLNGKRHRENGPAIEWQDGSETWYENGLFHREDGPAINSKGYKEWWAKGKRHRENGPALIYKNGSKEWWVNGERIKIETCTGRQCNCF